MNGKAKRTLTIVSIAIILTMLICNVFGMGAITSYERNAQISNSGISGIFLSTGPLEYMKDMPDGLRERRDRYLNLNPAELDEGIRHELEQDDGSTDRYIVKYKSGQKQAFQSKVSSSIEVAYSEAISVSVDRAISAKTQAGYENPSRNGRRTTILSIDWEVLILAEKMLPSEFAAVIQSSNAIYDIEFIQPDYMLSLDSINENEFNDNGDILDGPDDDEKEIAMGSLETGQQQTEQRRCK